MNDYGESLSSLNFGQRVSCIEKGQIRATIESPNKYIQPLQMGKRSKSQKGESMEFDIARQSVTPKNRRIGFIT